MLQLTEGYMRMLLSVGRSIEFINENGGFTVVGWYKRGVINDKSLLASRKPNGTVGENGGNNNNNEEDVHVDAGD